MKSDLIERQAAIDALENTKQNDPFDRYEYQNIGIEWAIDSLKALPSAQPDLSSYSDKLWRAAYERGKAEAQPQRMRGRYIGTEYDGYADGCPVYYEWKCSVCGCTFEDEKPNYNFCPNCGADMRGEQNDN